MLAVTRAYLGVMTYLTGHGPFGFPLVGGVGKGRIADAVLAQHEKWANHKIAPYHHCSTFMLTAARSTLVTVGAGSVVPMLPGFVEIFK